MHGNDVAVNGTKDGNILGIATIESSLVIATVGSIVSSCANTCRTLPCHPACLTRPV